MPSFRLDFGGVVPLVRALESESKGPGFKSLCRYQINSTARVRLQMRQPMAMLICFYRFPDFTMSLRPVNTLTRANLYSHVILAMLGLAALSATYHGWRLFWFFTDDAFIAFR